MKKIRGSLLQFMIRDTDCITGKTSNTSDNDISFTSSATMDTNNPAIPEIMLPDCAENSETTETSVTKEKVSANSVMGHAEAAVFDLPTDSDCI